MKQFLTVANMKLAHLAAGQFVTTQGFTAAGDGGGKVYLTAAAQAVDGLNDHTLAGGTVALVQGDVIITIADGDATPAVNKGNVFTTANTGATSITDFDAGVSGQQITVLVADGNTTFDFSSSGLVGNGGVDYVASTGDVVNATYDGTDWICAVSQPASGGAGGGSSDTPAMVDNLSIVASRTSNAETIHIKDAAGADPSASSPVKVGFIDDAGGFDVIEITAATSFTFSSGSKLGLINSVEALVAVVLINDGGTLRLGASGRPSGLVDNSVVSSTAEGGAGAADSARTIYTGAAVTDKRMRVLGYLTYTLATAGTWITAPSKINLTRAGATELYVPEVLYDVTLSSDGTFDTNDVWPNGIPLGYDKFEIEAELRSTASTTKDVPWLLFNGDTTNGNYSYGQVGSDNTTVGATRGDQPRFGDSMPGASSEANVFSASAAVILNPQNTVRWKGSTIHLMARYTSTGHTANLYFLAWESLTAIIRMQVITDNDPTDELAAGSVMRVTGFRKMTVLQ